MIKIYSYNNNKINIENKKIKYINVKNEQEIKNDIINTDRFDYLDTYIILDKNINIKNRRKKYLTYKIISETELRNNLDQILSDQYKINKK